LEDCTSRVWCVHDGEKWIDQSDVVLLVGEEAVREFEKSPEDRAREKAEKAAALAAAADAAAKSKILAAARAAVSDQVTQPVVAVAMMTILSFLFAYSFFTDVL